MLLALELRFAVFLLTFCVAHAEVLAHRQAHIPENRLTDHGFGGIHSRCSWNCTIIGTDLPVERKNVILKNRLVSFVVQYESKVEGECVNKTLRLNSSGNTNLTDVCQARLLANNEFPSFANRIECLLNRFYFMAECIEIRASCTLKPERTTVTKSPTNYSLPPFSLRFARGHLANLGIKFDSVKCKSKMTDTLNTCVNISNSTGNNIQRDQHSAWLMDVLDSLCTVFLFVFMQYSLVFLCLFSPTVVTENGIREIVLGGASPVSLRGLMGNYFFSDNDTIWHKARTLILRLLVLPFPFVAPAILFDHFIDSSGFKWFQFFGGGFSDRHLFHPFMMVCYGCYFIQAFYVSFFNVTGKAKPCLVCQVIKPNLNCNDKLPEQLINHLRMQPLVLVKCWRYFFTRSLVSYFKMSLIILRPQSLDVSCVCFLRFLVFITFLAAIPLVTVMLFLAGVALVLTGIFITSPVVRLCSATKSDKNNGVFHRLPLLIVFRIFVTAPAILAAFFVLLDAAAGYFIAIIVTLAFVFCEKCLPFLACLVLVCYYLWNSYSSFTDQYQDLAVTLFKNYKKSRHLHVLDGALATEQDIKSSNSFKKSKNKGNMVRIPKELFDMACEELMPFREGVCKLVLKVTLILCFVFLVFSMIMLWEVGATPVTKALVTFLTGSVPKIATIYFDAGRQRKLEALVMEEEVPKILEDYLNGTSKSNQGQDNCETNANEVPIFAHESEENIEMVNM